MDTARLTSKAWITLKREDYKLAIDFGSKSLCKDNKLNKELTITTLNSLAGTHSKLKNYPTTLEYYRQAYDLSKPTDDIIKNGAYQSPCMIIIKMYHELI
ncbi:unnamed protein product [Rotaria sp. Silwood2]|nr:unnamed protein product [Rotaria sp. Silwood2]CAF2935692.1 unnamed protein product [Rotaria sp. Silwood2]CAF3297028.1 unnamed protein product [Rotaria sp. Silwood2]CAF4613005.1 unnamed protein product [Rotaria sp. Silwood2]CAF4649468.1 unnamed protein product [Rotaria sp. Silwood2]